MEEPKALKDTISPRIRDGKVVLDDLTITREDLEGMDRFYIIACGSSYHVAWPPSTSWSGCCASRWR